MKEIICKIDKCENKLHAKGLCRKHYRKQNPRDTSPEYQSWRNMKTRCLNKNAERYKNYGGRGIVICERWLNSFDDFLLDMGPKPFLKAQIDRIDTNGNYEPSNCEWTTMLHNMRHRTITKLTMDKARKIRAIHAKDNGLTQRDIAKMFDISFPQVNAIIKNRQWKEGV